MAVNRRRNLVLVGAQRKQHTVPKVHSNEALRRARRRYRGWLYAPGSSQWWLAAAAKSCGSCPRYPFSIS